MTETLPQWDIQKVDIRKLKPNAQNPRTITKDEYEHLKRSMRENGYVGLISCDKDLNVIGGHQRLRVLKELGVKEVQIRIPLFELTQQQKNDLTLEDNISRGTFDMDEIANHWPIEDLQRIGFPDHLLPSQKDFDPVSEDEQGKLDEKKKCTCPNCGTVFTP